MKIIEQVFDLSTLTWSTIKPRGDSTGGPKEGIPAHSGHKMASFMSINPEIFLYDFLKTHQEPCSCSSTDTLGK